MTEIVNAAARSSHRLAVHDTTGAVWLTFSRPWWDLASWLWWWLTPGKKAWLLLRRAEGPRVRVRAVRLAKDLVHLGGER